MGLNESQVVSCLMWCGLDCMACFENSDYFNKRQCLEFLGNSTAAYQLENQMAVLVGIHLENCQQGADCCTLYVCVLTQHSLLAL